MVLQLSFLEEILNVRIIFPFNEMKKRGEKLDKKELNYKFLNFKQL